MFRKASQVQQTCLRQAFSYLSIYVRHVLEELASAGGATLAYFVKMKVQIRVEIKEQSKKSGIFCSEVSKTIKCNVIFVQSEQGLEPLFLNTYPNHSHAYVWIR